MLASQAATSTAARPMAALATHTKACSSYPGYITRFAVPESHVPWSKPFPSEYTPPNFTDPIVLANARSVVGLRGWADEEVVPREDLLARQSYCGPVVLAEGLPMNPIGRTGLRGRGSLGKWGPNHAADPIVTRYNPHTGDLEVILIKRRDTGAWAIPGGMVDAGEDVSVTLRREFGEETMNTMQLSGEQRERATNLLAELFEPARGTLVYEGYVDDPRNTDQAWMETRAVHFHVPPELTALLPIQAGDDAKAVKWVSVQDHRTIDRLYASHRDLVRHAIALMNSGSICDTTSTADVEGASCVKEAYSQGAVRCCCSWDVLCGWWKFRVKRVDRTK